MLLLKRFWAALGEQRSIRRARRPPARRRGPALVRSPALVAPARAGVAVQVRDLLGGIGNGPGRVARRHRRLDVLGSHLGGTGVGVRAGQPTGGTHAMGTLVRRDEGSAIR